MTAWVLFGAGALAAMLLVLHGFSSEKESADLMLETYREVLDKKQPKPADAAGDDSSSGIPTASRA